MSHSVSIYTDPSIFDGYGFLHTWIEVKDHAAGDVTVYSFGPESGLINTPGAWMDIENHDRVTAERTIDISQEQFDKIIAEGTRLSENPPQYDVLPDDGEDFNCVTMSDHLLQTAGITDLEGLINPASVEDRINDLNEYDLDGDDIPNSIDPEPNGIDTDKDGTPDSIDDDIDGDGIDNSQDGSPLTADRDQDGIPDSEDPTPDTPDRDNDGIPDREDSDIDGDGIPNGVDPAPNTPDRDGDGIPDGEDGENGSEGGEGGTPGDGAHEGSNNADRRRRIDPLVLDLDGDGLEFIGLDDSNAKFDLTGDGFATHTSWLGGDDGFLALDKNGDGRINGIDELFGSENTTGFEELSVLDSNNDGKISQSDTRFNDLLIWQDLNGDGKSTDDEIESLADHSITEISLTRTSAEGEVNDVEVDEVGRYTTTDALGNPKEHRLADVLFNTRTTYSEFVGNVELSEFSKSIANVKGYGMLPDLNVAVSMDETLASMVKNFTANLSSATILEHFDSLLIQWAGAKNLTETDLDVSPNLFADENGFVHFRSAGVSLSLSQLGVLKTYTGMNNLELDDGQWVEGGKNHTTGQYYLQAWNEIRGNLLVKFAVGQGLLDTYIPAMSYDLESDKLVTTFDFKAQSSNQFSRFLEALGNLNTPEKAADLVLSITTFTQFDAQFALNEQQAIFNSLTTSNEAAYQWLIDNQALLQELMPGIRFGERISGSSQSETLMGMAGNDSLSGNGGDDMVFGYDGNDSITTYGGNSVMDGGKGNDTITADYQTSNTLRGGEGDDTLRLSSTSASNRSGLENTFEGGTGNDNIRGGFSSSDTYVFNLGDGTDSISDYGDVRKADRIVFGEGISRENLKIVRSGNDIVLYVLDAEGNTTSDQITIDDAFIKEMYRIEEVVFADGTVLTAEEIHQAALIVEGGDENETITGSGDGDTISGHGGDDRINANGGDDTVYGGEGNDSIDLGSGTDLGDGGAGNDTITGHYESNNTLIGGDGDDTLRLSSTSSSRRSGLENTFEGGKGNDYLQGGYSSSDTYIFNLGDGQDLIRDIGDTRKQDRIVFGEGIAKDSIKVKRDGNDIVILLVDIEGNPTGDQITIDDAFTNQNYQIEKVEFSDGSVLTAQGLIDLALIIDGSEEADSLSGSSQSDTISGHGGDDRIDGNAGDDTIYGGAGNDIINAGTGTDVVDGGAGNDTISFDYQSSNTLLGGDGDDTLRVSSSSSSRKSNLTNTFEGGRGNDTMVGGFSSEDTYKFNLGDGYDSITDSGDSRKTDKIVFGEGITEANLGVTRSGNDLVLNLIDGQGNATGDQIVIDEAFSNTQYRIEEVHFSDGTVLLADELISRALIQKGTNGIDTLTGTSGADQIFGMGGEDTITSNAGDDIIDGGAGNDTIDAGTGTDYVDGGDGDDTITANYESSNTLLGGDGNDTIRLSSTSYTRKSGLTNTIEGGRGDDTLSGGHSSADTYKFNLGDGRDTITDTGDVRLTDKIVFGEGITQQDVRISRANSGDILIILVDSDGNPTGDQIQITGAFSSTERRIEEVQFADGSVMTAEELNVLAAVMSGTESDETLTGTSDDDTVMGLGGNDTINALSGDDIIDGGDGDDTIDAGSGTDIVDGGNGDDSITADYQSNNTLKGGAGNDTIKLSSTASSRTSGLNNTFEGGLGDDIIIGGYSSADTYLFNLGDGCDVISDSGDVRRKDRIVFGDGITQSNIGVSRNGSSDIVLTLLDEQGKPTGDQIVIKGALSSHNNRIEEIAFADGSILTADELHALALNVEGTLGDDNIGGTNEGDTVFGLGGNDNITTGSGDDTVLGGDGDDEINVGTGTDTADGGEGNDILTGDYQSNNTLRGGDGDDTLKLSSTSSSRRSNLVNTFEGGAGNDIITGGYSSRDTYLFGRGDGQDTITDNGDVRITDRIVFGEGITQEQIKVTRVGSSNLSITLLDAQGNLTQDSLIINNAFGNTNYRIEEYVFADGSTLTANDIHELALILDGTNSDDNLSGTSQADTISGLDGNDDISGGAGDDVIFGGSGDDIINAGSGTDVVDGGDGYDIIEGDYQSNNTLRGGAGDDVLSLSSTSSSWTSGLTNIFEGGIGNDRITGGHSSADTYLFNLGDGQDQITDSGDGRKTDKIVFGEGITRDSLLINRSGSDIVLTILDSQGYGTGDTIRLTGAFANQANRIEELVFTDGSVMTAEEVHSEALAFKGSARDDVITGSGEGEHILGLEGNDTIDAGAGDDTVEGGKGDDLIDAGRGNDLVEGGDGNDTIEADYQSNNVLRGGDGDDVISLSSTSSSTLSDISNTFEGGRGNDDLVGGFSSSDTYVFSRGDGSDTITDRGELSKTDRIEFGPGITRDQLSIKRSGSSDILITLLDSEGNLTWDEILIVGAFGNQANRIEELVFADGSVMTAEEVHTQALVIEGSNWDDQLTGTSESDTIRGLGGNDTINGGSGDDIISGGSGDDLIDAGAGADVVDGGDGYDTISADYQSNNTLRGGAGDDIITLSSTSSSNRSGLNNTFEGGSGNDVITGGHSSSDTYIFNIGDGADSITDSGDNVATDRIVFGEGITQQNIRITRGGSSDIIITLLDKQGNPTPDEVVIENAFSSESNRIEELVFADGSSLTAEQVHQKALLVEGSNWDDALSGTSEGDTIYGHGGNDDITSGAGDDTVFGGDGDDVIDVGAGNDTVDGGAGYDTITADYQSSNTLRGGHGDDIIKLSSTSSSNVENLTNTFEGGRGNDTLTGGYNSSDTYIYNLGDGWDSITDSGDAQAKDRIVFGAGISLDNLLISRGETSDIVLTVLDSDGNLTFDEIIIENAFSNQQYQIEELVFDDGTVLNAADIREKALTAHGSAGDDQITASSDNDVIYGNAGNDNIIANGGDDTIYGGEGDDRIDTGSGTDFADGGAGNDSIVADYLSNNTLHGGSGDDIIKLSSTGSSSKEGLANTFYGGIGNDTLNGGHSSSDTYHFALGDGRDVITDSGNDVAVDRIIFAEGITVDQLKVSRIGTSDIVLTLLDDNGNPTLDEIVINDAFGNKNYQIEEVVFADGTILTADDLHTQALVFEGTEQDDSISGTSENDTLYGRGGNDTIDGGYGSDIIGGGEGNDTITANYQGNNTLVGGDGDDTIRLSSTSSSSVTDLANTFDGGRGNDTLRGGYSSRDTYLFNLGDGRDVITDNGNDIAVDRIVFGEGIGPDDIKITRIGTYDIVLTLLDANGQPTLDEIVIDDALHNHNYRIEEVVFADGTILTAEEIHAKALILEGDSTDNVLSGTSYGDTIYGNGGNDNIDSSNGDDILDGGEGNDRLISGDGDDLLEGGAGNDYLDGGYGNDTLSGGLGDDTLTAYYQTSNVFNGGAGDDIIQLSSTSSTSVQNLVNDFTGGTGNDTLRGGYSSSDTYRFNAGDGQDLISDNGSSDKTDRIVFGGGISRDQIQVTRLDHDILITIVDENGHPTGDQITIDDAFSNNNYRIELLEFSDGSTMSADEIHTAAVASEQSAQSFAMNTSSLAQAMSSFESQEKVASYSQASPGEVVQTLLVPVDR